MKAKVDSIASRAAAVTIGKLFSGELPREDDGIQNPWHSDNRQYRDELISNFHLWADVDSLSTDEEILQLVDAKVLTGEARKGAQRWQKLSIAAGVLLCVLSGVWLTQNDLSVEADKALRYVTRIGEVKEVSLSDGSTMSLNTGSEVLYIDKEDSRTAILQRGEVYFEVEKDESRPFELRAGENVITVLGTSFFVRKYSDKVEILVTEGLVVTHPLAETVEANSPMASVLSPGLKGVRQLKIPAGWKVEVSSVDQSLLSSEVIGNVPGWTGGVLHFKNEELYKVVKELNRYSAKKILIEDKFVMGLTVNALVKIESMNTALVGFEMSMPIKVTHYFDKIVISGK
ncbi:FecR domain-containing protein [Porticoccaceae bacterium LTM1]|nr:FecR domain-containing protein [Porticoccaceae bacterium LTM1]